MPLKINYCKAIVIVHGKSELMMAEYIKSNLKLNMAILSNANGKSSIQVNGLLDFMKSDTRLKSIRTLEREFLPKVVGKRVEDFKVFTLMDLDDCTEKMAEKYKTKEMFESSWLYEYIVPIWSVPNFDIAMKKANVIKELPNSKEKASTYSKVFPMDHLNRTNIGEIEEFARLIKDSKCTNLKEFVDYCLKIATAN